MGINGSTLLREWVDNNEATVDDLEALASKDEKTWKREVQDFMLYH